MNWGLSKSAIALVAACSVLLPSLHHPATALCADTDDDYHRLLPKGMGTFDDCLTWAKTGKSTAIVFAVDRPGSSHSEHRLISFKLLMSGKTRSAVTFMDTIKGSFKHADAVTFDQVGTGATGGAAGLLFVAYYVSSLEKRLLHLIVAPFDAGGRRTAPFNQLMTVEIDKYSSLPNATVFAEVAGDSVGVALSAYSQAGYPTTRRESRAYFLTTDLAGNLTRGPKKVKLPGDTTKMKLVSLRPAYRYARWFVPCYRIDYKITATSPSDSVEPIGSTLLVYTAKPKNKTFAVKVREIESDAQTHKAGAYAGVQFLPEATSGIATPPARGITLFYQKRKYTEHGMKSAGGMVPLNYTADYYTRIVKKTTKALKPKKFKFDIDPWVSELRSKASDYWADSDEWVSEAVVANDGRLVMGLTRFQMVQRAVSPSDEGHPEMTGNCYLSELRLRSADLIYYQAMVPSFNITLRYFAFLLNLGGQPVFMLLGRLYGEEDVDAMMAKIILLSLLD